MEPFYTSDRNEWRNYLLAHYETETELWLIYPQKGSGEKALAYNDAVEEALCFGWIDSVSYRVDEFHRKQRFTPRRKNSPYSQPNIERLIWLDSKGMLLPKVKESVKKLIETPFVFPSDIIFELRKDPIVWSNYESFSEPYKRIRVAYIDAARKRPEEFKKRLHNFINKTREGKLIQGYGGVDKYYK